jgi:predicted GH43/DUF377 family glycosyl hydrolase
MKLIRTNITIKPDQKRVLLRPFVISSEERVSKILKRILTFPERDAKKELKIILKDFEKRHREVHQFFLNRFEQIKIFLLDDKKISDVRKLLIGAYFTNEYSPEAASLFNPCMVLAPDQSGISKKEKRFILSLRATGEGHISSIVFSSVILDKNNGIHLEERRKFVTNPQKIIDNSSGDNSIYEIEYSTEVPLSEKVIFPHSPSETNGIEDARFVQFQNEGGERTYFATYTAYDGKEIHPQIIETKDFLRFKISALRGAEVKNKGMALFPRKINGQYTIISRQDNENIFLMYSDNLYLWNTKKIIIEPKFPWEFVQLGNCGSPIETNEGWLLLSHGVGAMRKYSIGAFLLAKEDPSKMIGRLNKPLISPDKKEREGYVPNVVYSCGGIINNNELIIPYAMSDCACTFAKVNINKLLSELKSEH